VQIDGDSLRQNRFKQGLIMPIKVEIDGKEYTSIRNASRVLKCCAPNFAFHIKRNIKKGQDDDEAAKNAAEHFIKIREDRIKKERDQHG
jgi:hypothetical protein